MQQQKTKAPHSNPKEQPATVMEAAQTSHQKWLIDQLELIYDSEQKLLEALPGMKSTTSDKSILSFIDNEIKRVKSELTQIENIFRQLEKEPTPMPNEAFRALLKVQKAAIDNSMSEEGKNFNILTYLQSVKSYENSYYINASVTARTIGLHKISEQLTSMMQEENAKLKELGQLLQAYLTTIAKTT